MAAIVCYVLAFQVCDLFIYEVAIETNKNIQWVGQTKAWKNSAVLSTLIGGTLIIISFVIVAAFQCERSIILSSLFKKRYIWSSMVLCIYVV
jgi:hypothetical protein